MARRTTIIDELAEVPEMIRAIVVDPADRTMREVWLPTAPGDPARGFGMTQLAPEVLVAILGTKLIEQVPVGDDVLIVAARTESLHGWCYGLGDHVRGPGVLVGYDATRDNYCDTRRSAEDIAQVITFADGDVDEADEVGGNGHAHAA